MITLRYFPNRHCRNVLARIVFGLGLFLLADCFATGVFAQETYATSDMLESRENKRWKIPVAESGPTRIPRVCASLRGAYFEGKPDQSVVVHPEVEYWEIRFKGEPLASHVVLEFDSFPLLLEETNPTKQAGDGTLTLRCSQGRVTGEKLRFEPQQHKNTIGYWAVAEDTVSWPIQISQIGKFNVGLLQGSGKRGGGTAKVSLISDGEVVDSFEYQVELTGHFQNFKWKHGGELEAKTAGQYSLKIEATSITDIALMDVRQVHLSPQPKH